MLCAARTALDSPETMKGPLQQQKMRDRNPSRALGAEPARYPTVSLGSRGSLLRVDISAVLCAIVRIASDDETEGGGGGVCSTRSAYFVCFWHLSL